MKNGKVIEIEETTSQTKGIVLTPEEKKRLADFFDVLIEIDQRNRRKSKEVIKDERRSI